MARFAVTTFGCQMNKHDSERMEEVLRAAGHLPVARAAEAEVLVVNTCCVREKAEHKLRSELGRLVRLKRRQPKLVLVVAGCVAQQEGRRLVSSFPGLDLVIGPDNIAELPELLREVTLGVPPIVRTTFDLDSPRFLTALSVTACQPTAYVTTMKGCNERCSFCVVPNTRGPERYRPSSEIIAEIAQLVAGRVRQVTLLGQTVNSYVDPIGRLSTTVASHPADPDETEFPALLRLIAGRVPGLCRLRYEAPHPRYLTPSLIAAHQELSVLARHVHLPVQSGSDRILKRMIRRHTRAEFVDCVAKLRKAVPDMTVSTDIIVGFPGETAADFAETLSLLDEVGFVGVFAFAYSPRPKTSALKLTDDLSPTTKAQRLQQVLERSDVHLSRHLRRLVGSTQQVLVEGPSKSRPEHPSGRTARNEIVHLLDASDCDIVGQVCEVEIVEALGHSLLGRLASVPQLRERGPACETRSDPRVAGVGPAGGS